MDGLPRSILLATDGSEDALVAARAAVDLSKATDAGLRVVHAWQPTMPYMSYSPGMSEHFMELYEKEAGRILDHQVDRIRADGGEVVDQHLVMAPPVDAILDLCERVAPDLVVMGSRGMGPVRRALVGSVSEGVVHHAPCPVLVVRGGDGAWPPARVVIGDDGSEDAWRAARLAAGIGKLFGAETVLVRAYENPPEPVGGWKADDRRRLDETILREEDALKERAGELRETLGESPETRLVETDAVLALLEVGEEADEEKTLFAVGSRGLGAISRIRFGSVSTKVLRVARGSVLVCPHASR